MYKSVRACEHASAESASDMRASVNGERRVLTVESVELVMGVECWALLMSECQQQLLGASES
jgi:hypothetical protein